jgi:hypothetical protein
LSGSRGITSSDTLAEQIGFEQQRTFFFREKTDHIKNLSAKVFMYRLWGYTNRINFMGDDVLFV